MVRKAGHSIHGPDAARAKLMSVPCSNATTARQRAMRALAAVTLYLLCAGCTEGPANCRGEVEAAFERLRTSDRAYRKETIYIVSDDQTFHETAEFLQPDRMRAITNNGVPGYGTVEVIRIGPRAWSSDGGWHEWEAGLAQEIYGAGMDFSLLPDRAVPLVPVDAVFECLGRVEFKGKAYIG